MEKIIKAIGAVTATLGALTAMVAAIDLFWNTTESFACKNLHICIEEKVENDDGTIFDGLGGN